MSWIEANFALFVLEDVSNEEIGHIIQEAKDVLSEYSFWLADDFSNAPRRIRNEEHTRTETGTEPPIAKDWQSPFKGKTAQDAAAFLKSAPSDLSVDLHHFAVLGSDYKKDKLITIYRIGGEDLKGEELDSLLCSAKGATLFLRGLESGTWKETRSNHKDGDEPIG